MTAPPAGEALRHFGLVYDTPDELALTVEPELRCALERGDDVTLIVDRRVARAVREHLGPVADRAHFPPPRSVLGVGGRGALRAMRAHIPEGRAVRAGGRALLISQSDLTTATDEEFQEVEEGVDAVLADLPLTVLCCYAVDADPCHTHVCRRVHRQILTGRGPVDCPDYRPPAAGAPVETAAPAFWLSFRDTSDLRRVREGAVRAAAEAGLVGEAVDAAVLAVHEAAVLACHAAGDPPEDCVLELHTEPGALSAEVRAPRDLAPSAGTDPVAHIRPFCASVSRPHPHVVRLVAGGAVGG